MAAVSVALPELGQPLRSTPPTYHRILSPDLHVPEDKSQSIPVGLLACQRDPLLRELKSCVVSCRAHQPAAEANAKSGNNRKKANVTAKGPDLLEVVLHDTILFPEGGGQPSDTGILIMDNGEVLDVAEIKRHGGTAIHYVRRGSPGTEERLRVGAEVTTVLDEAGFARRLDHMCMHTSQHLLSAILETHFQLPTLSWALTSYPTPSYVELPRSLTAEEIARVQAIAHALAYEGRAVHVEVEQLTHEGPNANRPQVEKHESGRTIGKALPDDYTGGVKRVVVIDGVDRNPCCGTHLPSLHNLQLFLLPQTESLARGGTSTSRLYFLCGPRLHTHLLTTHNLLTTTSGIMSCGPSLVPERVSQVVEERKRMTKRAEELASELAQLIAAELVREMVSFWSNGDQPQPFIKHYHRTDDPSEALPFLQAVSFSFSTALAASVCAGRHFVLVLTSSAASQSSASVSTVLLAASDGKLLQTVGDGLKNRLGVKGGGKGTRWSGKRVGVWKESKEGVVVQEILRDFKLV